MAKDFYDLLKDRQTVYWITFLAILLEVFVTWFDANRKHKIATVILRAGVLTILAFILKLSSGDDQNWKNDVTRLQRLDSTLGYEIDSMSYVNHEIDSSTQVMVNSNNQLTSNNLELTKDADLITRKTEKVTQESKSISEVLNTKTDQEFEVTGEFDFPIDSSYSNGLLVNVVTGIPSAGGYTKAELGNGTYRILSYENFQINTSKHKFIITGTIYDLNDNIIVEIQENKWRLNKNSVSKFNYDNNGFEVFDNTGRVAMSLNFVKRGNLPNSGEIEMQVQGIFPLSKNREATIWIYGQRRIILPYGTRELNQKIRDTFDLRPVLPLFKYMGMKWRHVRNS